MFLFSGYARYIEKLLRVMVGVPKEMKKIIICVRQNTVTYHTVLNGFQSNIKKLETGFFVPINLSSSYFRWFLYFMIQLYFPIVRTCNIRYYTT